MVDRYLKKIANRAKTGIFKPFKWEGDEYVIRPVNYREDEKWQLWDAHPPWMKSTCIGLAELTGEELADAIKQLQAFRVLEEVHDS